FPWRAGSPLDAGNSGDDGDEGNGDDASALLTASSSPRVGILVSISAQPHTTTGALKKRTMESTGDAALVSSQTHVATILSCPGAPWKRPREEIQEASIGEASCDQIARHVILAGCAVFQPDISRRCAQMN